MKSNSHKKRTFEDKFARHFYCDHARLNSIRSDKKQARKQERAYNKALCKEDNDMTKVDWFYAATRIAKIYNTHWVCSDMFDEGDEDGDNFILCPECEEPILLEDYPELDAAADKSYCLCPICENRLDLV